jgi:hypothetical protein
MKSVVSVITFFFILFLSMPTIIALVEENTDIAWYYDNADEDESLKELKEIKAIEKQNFDFMIAFFEVNSKSTIIFENLSRHDNVTSKIFSPPPELV